MSTHAKVSTCYVCMQISARRTGPTTFACIQPVAPLFELLNRRDFGISLSIFCRQVRGPFLRDEDGHLKLERQRGEYRFNAKIVSEPLGDGRGDAVEGFSDFYYEHKKVWHRAQSHQWHRKFRTRMGVYEPSPVY